MERYIGVKKVKATPMNRYDYNTLRGWEMPIGEDPEDKGYLVEYLDSPNQVHPKFRNYISWSPKDVFERAYRKEDGLTFGDAIEALKQGRRVTRKGWNGKGMFLFLLPAGTIPTKAIHDPALREVIEKEVGGDTFEALGSIRMWTVNSEGRKAVLTGWLASQTDMLSADWILLD